MKKIYFTLGILTSATIAMAQPTQYRAAFPKKASMLTIPHERAQTSTISQRGGTSTDTIWYEGFANGIPTDWTIKDSANFCTWKHTKIGSQGKRQNPANQKLKSKSAANGYIILDADYCNDGEDQTKHKTVNSYFQTPRLDFANHPNVNLNFQHTFAYCCSPSLAKFEVQISNDSVDWVTYDFKREQPLIYTSYPNPLNESINISSVAGGKDSVWIRFYFAGSRYYFWMIDDILINTSPSNDVILKEALVDFIYPGSGYYTQTPLNQAKMNFRGLCTNGGVNDQSNVKLNVNVMNKNISVYDSTGAAISSLVKWTSDTAKISDSFVPTALGTYTAVFSINQDSVDDVTNNNTQSKNFVVSDSVYSRDSNNPSGGLTGGGLSIGSSSYTDDGIALDGTMLGNLYEFGADETEINSISVHIHQDSEEGASFTGRVFSVDFPVGGRPVFTDLELETEYYSIDATSKSKGWITMPFTNKDNSKELIPKDANIVAAIEFYGSPNDIMLSQDFITEQPAYSSWLHVGTDAEDLWYYTREMSFIRLNAAGCSTVDIKLDNIVRANGNSKDGEINTTVTGGTGLKYQWYKKISTGWSKITTNATNEDLKNVIAQKYSLTVTEANGCAKSVTFAIDTVGTAINEYQIEKSENFKIYPNPSTGIFNLDVKELGIRNWNLKAMNVLGQVVYQSSNIQHSTINIDLSHQPKGVYFLQISSDKDMITRKVVRY